MGAPKIPIEEILRYYGHDTSKGPGKVRCQFHDDETPSATWTEFRFNCFACGVWGDAVRLVKEQEGVDWREAYEIAEELAGVEHDSVAEEPGPRSGIPGGTGVLRGGSRFGSTRSYR